MQIYARVRRYTYMYVPAKVKPYSYKLLRSRVKHNGELTKDVCSGIRETLSRQRKNLIQARVKPYTGKGETLYRQS